MGGRRVGNVNISLFIPNKSKLSGSDVIELLDKLLDTYCKKYAPDNNLENIVEDWSFVTTLTSQYENRLRNGSDDDVENTQQSTGGAAYVYYSSKEELQKYFDAPYQEEYKPYKQVFFVELRLKNAPENPLNALRHDPNPNANLTGNIDLDNPKYKLLFNQNAKNGVEIKVEVNGNSYYGKKIRRKDSLKIIYSKQYYKLKGNIEKETEGKCYEIDEKFIIVDDNTKTITVKEIDESYLEPVTHTFHFETKDIKGKKLDNAEIILTCGYQRERKIENGKVALTEEELQKDCFVYAKKDSNLISQKKALKIADESKIIELILREYKKITFQVVDYDNNSSVSNYNVQICDRQGNIIYNGKEKDVYFSDDKINQSYKIIITHSKYANETFSYCPAKDENTKFVKLKKRQAGSSQNDNNRNEKKFYLKIDETKGLRTFHRQLISEYVHDHPEFTCDSRFGFKFVEWKRKDEKCGDYDGIYEAIFKELWYHQIQKKFWIIFIVILILLILLIALAVLILTHSTERSNTQLNKSQIESVLAHYHDNPDTLARYQKLWKEQKPAIKQEGGLWVFGKIKSDSTEYNQWRETASMIDEKVADMEKTASQKQQLINYLEGIELNLDTLKQYKNSTTDDSLKRRIDTCINFREDLNKGKISKIKHSAYQYSAAQQRLKASIDSIPDNKIRIVGREMNGDTISKMNLDEIADFINLKKQGQSGNGTRSGNSYNGKTTQNTNNTNASTLETEFWNLVRGGNVKKEDYDSLLKKYNNQTDDYVSFLKDICKDSKTFSKFKTIPEEHRKSSETTLSELRNLLQ
jgi:hypothetical protein